MPPTAVSPLAADIKGFQGQLYAATGFELLTAKALPGRVNGWERAKERVVKTGKTLFAIKFLIRGNNGKST